MAPAESDRTRQNGLNSKKVDLSQLLGRNYLFREWEGTEQAAQGSRGYSIYAGIHGMGPRAA